VMIKMCEWGTSEIVIVTIPATLSHTGTSYKKQAKIDKCIAPLVRALENTGLLMTASCCGHGKTNGQINLQDGRTLIITPSK
jgi:hypothetical protein